MLFTFQFAHTKVITYNGIFTFDITESVLCQLGSIPASTFDTFNCLAQDIDILQERIQLPLGFNQIIHLWTKTRIRVQIGHLHNKELASGCQMLHVCFINIMKTFSVEYFQQIIQKSFPA